MRDVLSKAKAQLVLREPFYATILMGLKAVVTDEVSTLATDGTRLLVNEAFFKGLKLSQQITVLKHEALHVALLHPWRRQTRHPMGWNVACDYVVNAKLVEEKSEELPDWLYDPRYKNMSSEQVYNRLPVHKQPSPVSFTAQAEGSPSSGGAGGDQPDNNPPEGMQPSPSDAVDKLAKRCKALPASDVLDAQDDAGAGEQRARQLVARAVAAAKQRGLMPAHLEAELGEVLNPRVPWQDVLRRFLTEMRPCDYSWARPARRMVSSDLYMPSIAGAGAMRDLAVVVDTSGSVSDDELRQFFGEFIGAVEACSPGAVRLVWCDAEVAGDERWQATPSAEELAWCVRRLGGGGTDMTVGLDALEDDPPQAAVVFTDGGTPFGEPRGFPVLWAITGSDVSPWGETVRVTLGD